MCVIHCEVEIGMYIFHDSFRSGLEFKIIRIKSFGICCVQVGNIYKLKLVSVSFCEEEKAGVGK